MRIHPSVWRLCAAPILLCASGAAQAAPEDTLKEIQAEIDALKKRGTVTANPGSLVIESWLLTSTAIDSTAQRMTEAIQKDPDYKARPVLIVTGAEPLDFGQVEMLQLEIDWLTARLNGLKGGGSVQATAFPLPAVAGAVIGLLKSDVQLDAISQDVDAKLLGAAIAAVLPRSFLPSAAIGGQTNGQLIRSFKALMDAAAEAQTRAGEDEQEELKALLARYDALSTRLLTPDKNGVAPLAFAARLQNLIKHNPYVLRVNTEKAGGTLLKRTNVLTALGAESTFISGGLVSSYQMTDPNNGTVVAAGVITCRTTLTSLKRVQQGSWKSSDRKATAVCLP